ncbi:MAG: glycosyltransferase family 4 protein [Planctomycetaceae bacterium]|nr:glycosyltransferase family 4 protein [Planctomycetaceae bacterium]
MNKLRLLQVCNVGRIVGGTAACAWTITRALPEFEHVVAFLSEVTDETRSAFAHARIERWSRCLPSLVDAQRPDVVILHNIGGKQRMSRRIVTLQYVHSAGTRAPADRTVYCSRWLSEQMGRSPDDVLYQGVPRPVVGEEPRSCDRDGRLVIGRICTPTARKWPRSMLAFYRQLAECAPQAEWEFVGCPGDLQSELSDACGGRTRYFAAGWNARSRLWNWDALLYHNPEVIESFGRTVAESLRAGCIPIVDRRGGFIEQVTPETGFLCGTVGEFCESVARLQKAELRRRMSAKGRGDADQRFSIIRFRSDLLARMREAATRWAL